MAPLLDLAAPSAVLLADGVSSDVSDSLTEMGFSMGEPMPAMAVDIDAMASTRLPPGYESMRVVAESEAGEWTGVLASGYPLPHGLARLLSPEVLEAGQSTDAKTQFFGIRREDKLVATSMLYLADGLAGVYCVATLAEERGKGLGAHVTAAALRAAHQGGYKVGVLQSSEAGHSIYLALGFQDVGEVHMFTHMPAVTA